MNLPQQRGADSDIWVDFIAKNAAKASPSLGSPEELARLFTSETDLLHLIWNGEEPVSEIIRGWIINSIF
jgi:hypothetical protein